jgi:hypothetical protein
MTEYSNETGSSSLLETTSRRLEIQCGNKIQYNFKPNNNSLASYRVDYTASSIITTGYIKSTSINLEQVLKARRDQYSRANNKGWKIRNFKPNNNILARVV